MPQITVPLSSGAYIEIQTSHDIVGRAGVEEASPLDKLTKQDWEGIMERVADLANNAIVSLRQKILPCKEVSVEFGVSAGGKTGLILVEGTASANFKVTLKW